MLGHTDLNPYFFKTRKKYRIINVEFVYCHFKIEFALECSEESM